MPSHTPRDVTGELAGLSSGKPKVASEAVFEVSAGALHSRINPAIAEDFGEQLHQAQERLLDLRQQQEVIERQREELEELQRKQSRFLKGRVDVVERLTKGLTRLDRETFQTRKKLELLDHAKQNFGTHLDTIEALNPEHWARADLRNELVRATAAVEDAEQEYLESMTRLGMLGHNMADIPDTQHKDSGAHFEWPDFRYWLMVGVALFLPIIVLVLVLFGIRTIFP